MAMSSHYIGSDKKKKSSQMAEVLNAVWLNPIEFHD